MLPGQQAPFFTNIRPLASDQSFVVFVIKLSLSLQACKVLGGNQSALNIKYAVKRQKSPHAADDGETRAVWEEVWMKNRRMDTNMCNYGGRARWRH